MLENLNPESGENRSGSLRHGILQVNTCSCFRAVCPQVGNPRLCGPGPAAHAPLLPLSACRVCQVWFTRPIWMRSDHQAAWICTWTEKGKKKKKKNTHRGYPLSDMWSRVRDQGGGSQRSEGSFSTHGWSSPQASKRNQLKWCSHFFILSIFSSLSFLSFSVCGHHWPLWRLSSSHLSITWSCSRFPPFVERVFLPRWLLWRSASGFLERSRKFLLESTCSIDQLSSTLTNPPQDNKKRFECLFSFHTYKNLKSSCYTS